MTKKLLYSYKSCLSYGGPSAIFQQRSANRNNSVSPGGAASLYKTPTQAQEPRHRKDLSENSVVDKILDYLCKGNAREKEKLLNKILNQQHSEDSLLGGEGELPEFRSFQQISRAHLSNRRESKDENAPADDGSFLHDVSSEEKTRPRSSRGNRLAEGGGSAGGKPLRLTHHNASASDKLSAEEVRASAKKRPSSRPQSSKTKKASSPEKARESNSRLRGAVPPSGVSRNEGENQQLSFDGSNGMRSRILKQLQKQGLSGMKDETKKALMNYEDLKKRIMKDYTHMRMFKTAEEKAGS